MLCSPLNTKDFCAVADVVVPAVEVEALCGLSMDHGTGTCLSPLSKPPPVAPEPEADELSSMMAKSTRPDWGLMMTSLTEPMVLPCWLTMLASIRSLARTLDCCWLRPVALSPGVVDWELLVPDWDP